MNQLVELLNNNPEKKERDIILEFENFVKEIKSYEHSKNTLGEACMVGDMEKLITSILEFIAVNARTCNPSEIIEKMEQSYTKRELSVLAFVLINKFFDNA